MGNLTVERIDQVTNAQALFTDMMARPTIFKSITGPMPKQADAEMRLAGKSVTQSDPGMPIVRANDSTPKTDDALEISMKVYTRPKVEPRMDNEWAKGYTAAGEFSRIKFNLGLARFPYDMGTQYDQHHTEQDIEGLTKAGAISDPERWQDQLMTVNLFSGRGIENHNEWTIPLQGASRFDKVVVNPIKAPAAASHYRWNQSANQIVPVAASDGVLTITTADVMSTEMLDGIIKGLAANPYRPTPVQFAATKAGRSKPTWLMLIPEVAMTELSSRDDYRSLISAIAPRGNTSAHPVFEYTEAKWGSLQIMTVPWNVFWDAEKSVQYCADPESQTESSAVVPTAFGSADYVLTRALIVGASAIAFGTGTMSGNVGPVDIRYEKDDFEFRTGLAVSYLGGCTKVQYQRVHETGRKFWCDKGIQTIDFALHLGSSTYDPFKR